MFSVNCAIYSFFTSYNKVLLMIPLYLFTPLPLPYVPNVIVFHIALIRCYSPTVRVLLEFFHFFLSYFYRPDSSRSIPLHLTHKPGSPSSNTHPLACSFSSSRPLLRSRFLSRTTRPETPSLTPEFIPPHGGPPKLSILRTEP